MTDHVKPGDALAGDLQRLIGEYPRETAQGMVQELESVMAESQLECPVDKGILVATGAVEDPVITPGSITCGLGYGTNYGIHVHERLDVFHMPPTKAKFLEDPLMRRLTYGYMFQQITGRVNAILGVGI